MKKLLILITTILMCIVLAACANEAPAGEDTEGEDTHYAVEDIEAGTGRVLSHRKTWTEMK